MDAIMKDYGVILEGEDESSAHAPEGKILHETLPDFGHLLADELPLRDVCDHHGNIDPAKWDAHWAQQDSFIQSVLSSSAQAARPPQRLPKKKLRRSRTSMLWRFTAGQWVRKDPLESLWYRDYIVDPRQRAHAPDAGAMEKFGSQFRRRFRMTYR